MKGLPFTQGSLLFKDRIATYDDPLVQRLEEKGAIIVGKAYPCAPGCVNLTRSSGSSRLRNHVVVLQPTCCLVGLSATGLDPPLYLTSCRLVKTAMGINETSCGPGLIWHSANTSVVVFCQCLVLCQWYLIQLAGRSIVLDTTTCCTKPERCHF